MGCAYAYLLGPYIVHIISPSTKNQALASLELAGLAPDFLCYTFGMVYMYAHIYLDIHGVQGVEGI